MLFYVPKEKRYKLDEVSEKCIFLGYSLQSKGYRLYSLKGNNVIISRDVIFDKNSAWNWEEKKAQQQVILDVEPPHSPGEDESTNITPPSTPRNNKSPPTIDGSPGNT